MNPAKKQPGSYECPSMAGMKDIVVEGKDNGHISTGKSR
jgi:hypothetical protein